MLTLAGVSASARPLVISGIALAMPPLPVLVPTPPPVQRNQDSRVKVEASRPAACAERHVLARAVEGRRAGRNVRGKPTSRAPRAVVRAVDRDEGIVVLRCR